jgi:hypothetical protein
MRYFIKDKPDHNLSCDWTFSNGEVDFQPISKSFFLGRTVDSFRWQKKFISQNDENESEMEYKHSI